MEPSRRGKIARLPRDIREQLNHRLDQGDPQNHLVEWLNAMPEVQDVMLLHFDGNPIRPQNLSEWKSGGYRDWRAQAESREMAQCLQEEALAGKSDGEGLPTVLDALVRWLTLQLVAETRRIAEAAGEERWKLLRQFSRELAALRRADLQKQRLDLERERASRQAEQGTRPGKGWQSQEDEDSAEPAPEDPDRPTKAERIAALREVFFADVYDGVPINLPPNPGDPGYQPGIRSDGEHWFDCKGNMIPSPKDDIIKEALAAKAAREEEKRRRIALVMGDAEPSAQEGETAG